MKTFAIFALKGGVGKTTTAINLAYILAEEHNKRVLLVDGDAQANATQLLLPKENYPGLAALLTGDVCHYDELIQPTEISTLDVLPSSDDLWAVDFSCITKDGSKPFGALLDMRVCIEEDDAYDVMVIDCPPNFSAACVSAIRASDCIIIPILPDAFSAEGMVNLIRQIDSVRAQNPAVRIGGCLVTQWHNTDVVTEATDYIRRELTVPVYDTMIRRTDKVIESTWAKQPVLVWSPQSSAAKDYRAWVKELLEREAMDDGR
jgi:chromosome partitioning protein